MLWGFLFGFVVLLFLGRGDCDFSEEKGRIGEEIILIFESFLHCFLSGDRIQESLYVL